MIYADVLISLDGFLAGPEQSEENPMGHRALDMHRFRFDRATLSDRDRGVEERHAAGVGAGIMGRNMFGPIRGEWTGDWNGWWGDEPPFGFPVFVLTHHARASLEMEGGTTFHFVTDGFDAALARAREAAGDRHVQITGGASTIQQALAAGVVDELRLRHTPFVLGAGERFFDGLDPMRFEVARIIDSPNGAHVTYRRRD